MLANLAVPYKVDKRGGRRGPSCPSEGINAPTGLVSTARDLAKFDPALDTAFCCGAIRSRRPGRRRRRRPAPLPDGPRLVRAELPRQHGRLAIRAVDNAYSAMIVKVPARRATMILLANSDGLAIRSSSRPGTSRGRRSPWCCSECCCELLGTRLSPGRETVRLHRAPLSRRRSREWQFTPCLGYSFNGSTTLIDFGLLNNQTANDEPHLNFGGSVSLLGEGPFGLEALYIDTPNFFESKQFNIVLPRTLSSRTYALMGNAVLTTPRSWNRYGLRPLLSGGIGLIHAVGRGPARRARLSPEPVGRERRGRGRRLPLGPRRHALRLPLLPEHLQRARGGIPTLTLGDPLRLRYWTASFGVVFRK